MKFDLKNTQNKPRHLVASYCSLGSPGNFSQSSAKTSCIVKHFVVQTYPRYPLEHFRKQCRKVEPAKYFCFQRNLSLCKLFKTFWNKAAGDDESLKGYMVSMSTALVATNEPQTAPASIKVMSHLQKESAFPSPCTLLSPD